MSQQMTVWARAVFGLSPSAEVHLACGMIRPPRASVGQALALADTRAVGRKPAVPLIELVTKDARWVGLWPVLPDVTASMERAGVKVDIWDGDDGVITLAAHGSAVRWEGAVTADAPDDLLIDVRSSDAAVHVVSRDAELVFRFSRDEVTVGVVRRTLVVPPLPVVALPAAPEAAVDGWLGQDGAARWLDTAARQLASSPSSVDRLAAAGLVARLWVPTRPPKAFVFPPAPGALPVDRVIGWAATLTEPLLAFVETAALERADSLADALSALAKDTVASAEARESRFRVLRRTRDDMACVETILRVRGRHELLATTLDAVDERAHSLDEHLPASLDVDDDRLAAVSATNPDAWWGEP